MSLTIERRFHVASETAGRRGGQRRRIHAGEEAPVAPAIPAVAAEQRAHPLALRMAMAIECRRLIETGGIAHAAELARMVGVTRARMTQILNLTLLAPDVQERLLGLGQDHRVDLRRVSRAAGCLLWTEQRRRLGGAVTGP